MDILIQKLFPDYLPVIDPVIISKIPDGDGIPISSFMKYFTEKPPLPEKKPGANEILMEEWKAKRTLDKLKRENRSTWNDLDRAIQDRIKAIEAVKNGFRSFPNESLGIIVKLASLGNITPIGATAE